MPHTTKLQILSEKTLHNGADAALVTYCPSMDLIALVTRDQQVFIYRINGQRVYGAAQKGDRIRVESLQWKPNGQLLAIAWSDGSIRLISIESNKIVHQFSTGTEVSGITCMGWCSNLTTRSPSAVKLSKDESSWRSLLETNLESSRESLDLPRDLSLIDIEVSLPKLSVLAAGGTSEDVFSSRPSLDALFRPFDPKDNNAVDVMVVGTQEGNIHISIYDSFVVGSFSSPVILGNVPAHLIYHASHELCSTHSLLMKQPSDDTLHFVPVDLRFISTSSSYLSLLASRSTALHNLLRYISQTQSLMMAEWESTQDLPSRLRRNINETLEEKGNGNIVQALYHSVATGHTFPSVKEWLVDELSERGHKRWDKAVTTGLENLKRLVHENMLPALDRCSVILSRFSGIAKFQSSNEAVGFTNHQISLLVDTVACLHLISSKILVQVVDEIELFTSFSSWLRYEIDRLATDASSTSNDDTAEKEALIDHSKVLLYLQTAMNNSPLDVFLSEPPLNDLNSDKEQPQQSLPTLDALDEQLQKEESGLPYNKSMLNFQQLCKTLTKQASGIFGQIAEAEKRNVLFGKHYDIGIMEKNSALDMKTSALENGLCQSYIAYIPRSQSSSVRVVRVNLAIERGISSLQSVESSTIQLGNGMIKDIKFTDQNTILILWESNGSTNLLSILYNRPLETEQMEASEYFMKYGFHDPSGLHPPPVIFNTEDIVPLFSKHQLPIGGSFIPERMSIRNRSSRYTADNTRRIVLLGKDGLQYKIFQERDPASENDGDIPMS